PPTLPTPPLPAALPISAELSAADRRRPAAFGQERAVSPEAHEALVALIGDVDRAARVDADARRQAKRRPRATEPFPDARKGGARSEEHTSELQSPDHLV